MKTISSVLPSFTTLVTTPLLRSAPASPSAPTPPIAKPRTSSAPADRVKPAITPRTLLPGTHLADTPMAKPIPAPRSDLAKANHKAHTAEHRLSSAFNEFVKPKVNALKQLWEARSSTAQ